MSHYDYQQAMEIGSVDYPFHSLVMAAMLKADPMNQAALRREFPEQWKEFHTRYHAPGGLLPGESY